VNITLLQNIIYQGFAAFLFYNLRTLGAIGSCACGNLNTFAIFLPFARACLGSPPPKGSFFILDDKETNNQG
jgi:hypothetical protein